MSIVYQLTFFLALSLLAIVVTVFVFAASIIGRATETAAQSQEEILLNQKLTKEKQIEEVQEELTRAKKQGQLDASKLSERLKSMEAEIAGYQSQLDRVKRRVMLIRRKGAVIYPGSAFLAAVVASIGASGSAEVPGFVAILLWAVSLGAITFGIFRVFWTLRAIEEVTITSKESAEKLPEAVKKALKELEEEKKPKLELQFGVNKPPFSIEAGKQATIAFRVQLLQGDVAKNAAVHFFAPPGFGFPGRKTWLQDEDVSGVAGYVSTSYKVDDIKVGVFAMCTIEIRAPSKTDTFDIKYRLICEGFDSGLEEFQVVVTPAITKAT